MQTNTPVTVHSEQSRMSPHVLQTCESAAAILCSQVAQPILKKKHYDQNHTEKRNILYQLNWKQYGERSGKGIDLTKHTLTRLRCAFSLAVWWSLQSCSSTRCLFSARRPELSPSLIGRWGNGYDGFRPRKWRGGSLKSNPLCRGQPGRPNCQMSNPAIRSKSAHFVNRSCKTGLFHGLNSAAETALAVAKPLKNQINEIRYPDKI